MLFRSVRNGGMGRHFEKNVGVILGRIAMKNRNLAPPGQIEPTDRKSVVKGKSVDLGGRRIIKKKKNNNQ